MEKFNEHTFAICAYKESKFLEECIESIINQEVESNIIIATSTNNDYITKLGEKYNIPVYVRDGKPDIQDDWNFAYKNAKTKYVTIAHQDDIYNKDYSKHIKNEAEKTKDSIMFFTDYRELKNGKVIPITSNLKIKKILLAPLRIKGFRKSKFIRRRVLSLGSAICCPSVTLNKEVCGDKVFTSEYKCNLDWDTWAKLAVKDGRYIYINKELMCHRIHEESETSNSIANNVRQTEDYEMFLKFWPKPIVNILMKYYVKSLKTNNVE